MNERKGMRHGSLFTATQKGVENGHVGSEGEERDTGKYKERMRGGEREREIKAEK